MVSLRHALTLTAVVIVLLLGVFFLLAQPRTVIAPKVEPATLPVLGTVGGFTLTNAQDAPFNANDLEGKFWVADFFFTSCAGPCPLMTSHMKRLQDAFEGEERVNFVSISVDPETDTPERLTMYGTQYGADFKRWHFLTGPMESIREAAAGMMIGSADDPNLHSTRFILVDDAGNIRGYYHGIDEESVEDLQEALTRLLQEQA